MTKIQAIQKLKKKDKKEKPVEAFDWRKFKE